MMEPSIIVVGEDYYQILENIDKAIVFAEEQVKKELVEILTYNDKGNFIKIFRPENKDVKK